MPTWNEPKRRRNLKLHGLDFKGADAIWDHFTVTREDVRKDYGEKRLVTFGLLNGEAVVWSMRTATTTCTSSRYARLKNMKRAITLKSPKTTSVKADPDNPPWSEEMLGPPKIRRGRGKQKAPTKVLTTVRLDADVIAFFQAQGPGYQTRINDALRRVKNRGLARRLTSRSKQRRAG